MYSTWLIGVYMEWKLQHKFFHEKNLSTYGLVTIQRLLSHRDILQWLLTPLCTFSSSKAVWAYYWKLPFTPEHAKTFPMNNDSSQWRGCEVSLRKSNLKPANAAVPNMEPYLQMPGRVCHLDGSVFVQSYPHTSDLAGSGCCYVSVK